MKSFEAFKNDASRPYRGYTGKLNREIGHELHVTMYLETGW